MGRKHQPESRIVPEAGGRFCLEIRWTSERRRERTRKGFDSEKAAIKAQTVALRRVEDGLPPFPEVRVAFTVAEACRWYLAEGVTEARTRSVERMKEHETRLVAVLGDREAESVRYEDLLAYKKDRKAEHRRRTERGLSDVTVKKELSFLRAAFRFAKVTEKLDVHVFERLTREARGVLFPEERSSAGQVIEDAVLEAIVARLDPAYARIVGFMRLSGMRKGEACGLVWADVKRDAIYLADRDGNKTGARRVPLTPAMAALLPPRRLDATALVFEAPGGGSAYHGLGQAWGEARGKARVRLHDLRHSRATELDELGDRPAMKAALGMSDQMIDRVYARHRIDDRADALFARAERSQIGQGR